MALVRFSEGRAPSRPFVKCGHDGAWPSNLGHDHRGCGGMPAPFDLAQGRLWASRSKGRLCLLTEDIADAHQARDSVLFVAIGNFAHQRPNLPPLAIRQHIFPSEHGLFRHQDG